MTDLTLIDNDWPCACMFDGRSCGSNGCGCGGGLVLLPWPGLALHGFLEWTTQGRGITGGQRECERGQLQVEDLEVTNQISTCMLYCYGPECY